jgi:hypothetical protein
VSSGWLRRLLAATLLVVSLIVLSPGLAAAQETPPETFPEPQVEPTVERDIQDTDDEFRVALIGLIGVAVVTFVLILLYWRHTGRAARRRFEAVYGPGHDEDYYPHEENDDVGFYEQPPGWR